MLIHQIIQLIPTTQRKQGVWVTLLSMLQALLNMAGLTVLIPLIILVIDPEKLIDYPWFLPHRNLIIISIICFIVIKNLSNIWINNIRIRYINKLYYYYSGKLYDNYYQQGLLFIKEKHSDELTYNTNAVSYLFTHGTLSLTFSIVSETLLLVFIWCGIFWFSPLIGLSIAVCLLPFIIIYLYWFRKKLTSYGKKENEAKRQMMTIVGDTFRGYPDIKLNDAYAWFKKRFDTHITQIGYCREWITRTLYIPTGMMECYITIGLILFILIGGNNNDTRLTLGILAVASLRMLPSLSSLITMATQWKNNAFTIEILKDIHDMEEADENPQAIDFQKQIKVDNISYHYPGQDSFILRDFSLHINKGECFGIQGMSGIGKTTLFNLLLGFYMPKEGQIQIDDILLDQHTSKAWQRLIAYVPQEIFIMDATLAENIALGAEDIDSERMMSAIERSGLKDYTTSLTHGIHTRIGQNGNKLSGGERQRVGIARALYKKAEVLFFDESTSSLDPKTEENIMSTIQKLSAEISSLTIIIISHRQSVLSFCDRIIDIKR